MNIIYHYLATAVASIAMILLGNLSYLQTLLWAMRADSFAIIISLFAGKFFGEIPTENRNLQIYHGFVFLMMMPMFYTLTGAYAQARAGEKSLGMLTAYEIGVLVVLGGYSIGARTYAMMGSDEDKKGLSSRESGSFFDLLIMMAAGIIGSTSTHFDPWMIPGVYGTMAIFRIVAIYFDASSKQNS